MKGHIRQRGTRSFELKFDGPRGPDGKRKVQYVSFRGSKREAQIKLAKLIAAVDNGTYVEPTKATVAAFVRERIAQWEAKPDGITTRTAERYQKLYNNQIVPHLGTKLLQKLTRLDIEGWHNALHRAGLGARTIGHAHRVLNKALDDAEKDGLIVKNVCRLQRAPKVTERDIVIVQDIPGFIAKIRGSRLYVPALLALVGGLRLGETLALRDCSVDLDRGLLRVREALEETKAYGVRFKQPKSKADKRDITLPAIAIEALREHRQQLLETR